MRLLRREGIVAGSRHAAAEAVNRLRAAARVRRMRLADYRPVSQLVVPVSEITVPRHRVVDAHNHLGREFGGNWIARPVRELLDMLDEVHVDMLVDLDGGWGEAILEQHLDHFKAAAPERFQVFGGVDWSQWPAQGDRFGEWAARRLEAQVRRGAQGLKVWKSLGLTARDQHGALVAVNDPRLDALWATAGQLGVPVLMHIADPVAFFEPVDRTNERFETLARHPEWSHRRRGAPPFSVLIEQFADLVLRHPGTTFIGAHVGCYAENLGWVSQLLERAPNLYVDISARLAELGRQPHTARRFCLQHRDRILFGVDEIPRRDIYRLYYRFLESEDDYFDYDPEGRPLSGRWKVYGLNLPDDVLRAVYYENARRVLAPG